MQLFTNDEFGFSGRRLDVFLSERFADFSRSKVKKIIEAGGFRVNGGIVKAGYLLKPFDKIDVNLDETAMPKFEEEFFDLRVILDDKNFMVIEKPAGMVVHPGMGEKHLKGTVANKVRGVVNGFEGDERPGIVHRLDKDTSGLLIVAKNPETKEYFSALFKARKVEKRYLALVEGVFDEKAGVVEAPIFRSRVNHSRMVINSDEGRYAKSIYRVKGEYKLPNANWVSLVEVEIETGRTHQIRVHLSAIGHDVIGDEVYGDKTLNEYFCVNYGLKRQFLHAAELAFKAPGDKKITRLSCELPDDLSGILSQL